MCPRIRPAKKQMTCKIRGISSTGSVQTPITLGFALRLTLALVPLVLLTAQPAEGQRRHSGRASAALSPLRPRPPALSIPVQQWVLSNGLRVVCSTQPAAGESAVTLLVPLGTRHVSQGLSQQFSSLHVTDGPTLTTRVVLEEELSAYITQSPFESLELSLSATARRMTIPPSLAGQPNAAVYSAAYSPQRAMLSVVTSHDCAEIAPLIRRYFSAINARSPEFAQTLLSPVPAQEQRLQWAIPSSRSPDHYALTLTGTILCDLLRPLDGAASPTQPTVTCSTLDRSAQEQLTVGPIAPSNTSRLPQLFAQIAANGITGVQLERAVNQLRVRYLRALESPADRSFVLGRFALRAGDAGLVNTELDRFESVRVQDVQRVVTEYLHRPVATQSAESVR